MSNADLELIIEAGGAYLQVGVESGSLAYWKSFTKGFILTK